MATKKKTAKKATAQKTTATPKAKKKATAELPKKEETRLLPSDYSRRKKLADIHYSHLDDSEKNMASPRTAGFFEGPEDIAGEQHINESKFLVFYFKEEQDYNDVLAAMDKVNSQVRSHPDLDSVRLAKLVRLAKKNGVKIEGVAV